MDKEEVRLCDPMDYDGGGQSLQLCSTLCDPMDCSPPGSSIHGIFQARVLEWGAIALQQSMAKELDMTE